MKNRYYHWEIQGSQNWDEGGQGRTERNNFCGITVWK